VPAAHRRRAPPGVTEHHGIAAITQSKPIGGDGGEGHNLAGLPRHHTPGNRIATGGNNKQ